MNRVTVGTYPEFRHVCGMWSQGPRWSAHDTCQHRSSHDHLMTLANRAVSADMTTLESLQGLLRRSRALK